MISNSSCIFSVNHLESEQKAREVLGTIKNGTYPMSSKYQYTEDSGITNDPKLGWGFAVKVKQFLTLKESIKFVLMLVWLPPFILFMFGKTIVKDLIHR